MLKWLKHNSNTVAFTTLNVRTKQGFGEEVTVPEEGNGYYRDVDSLSGGAVLALCIVKWICYAW